MILVPRDQSLVLARQQLDKLEHRSPSKGLQQSVSGAGKMITASAVPDVRSSRSYQIPACIKCLLQVPSMAGMDAQGFLVRALGVFLGCSPAVLA